MITHLSCSVPPGNFASARAVWGPPIPLIPLLPAPEGLAERLLQGMRSRGRLLPQLQMVASRTAPRSDAAKNDTSGSVAHASGSSVGASGQADQPDESTTSAASTISMEQMVRDHADAVYRVALSITKDPILAEDVSQDVLIKAWQSLPSYRGEAPLRHWILRITHNVSISTLRRRREDAMAPADFPEQATTDRSVDTQVQDRMAIARFEAALGDLDGVSRSIVVLREVEGMSYGEMSDVLELPLPTIRTRLLRARRQLADALDGWQP